MRVQGTVRALADRCVERGRLVWAGLAHWWRPAGRTWRMARPAGNQAFAYPATAPPALVVHLATRDTLRAAFVEQALARQWPADAACLLVLVRYRTPPLLASRPDGPVGSWAAAPALLARLPPPETGLLALLDAALQLPDVRVRVVQVPYRPAPAFCDAANVQALDHKRDAVAWVVPHCGSVAWLNACLAGLNPQLAPADEALICLDESPSLAVRTLQRLFPGCWFGVLRRPGVGPFVARQRALERTRCPLLLFQDSDDVPTADRAHRLQRALHARALDAVGSHELRLDYLTGRVVAVRFPLDASAALRVAVGHPALFPTLLVRRAALLAVGGFATHLRFALDTQLLLRAAGSWRIGNVDEFLYLRRRRPGSLTTTPATALGSPAREEHRARWKHDFAAVKAGRLPLETSSLAVQRGAEYAENHLDAL